MKSGGNWKKRVIKFFVAVMILTCMPLHDCQKVRAASFSDFINDARWCHGTSWTASQKRKIYDSWDGSGCFAYIADFVKYVYGKSGDPRGTRYTNIDEVRAGDVIHMRNSSEGEHWFVVLDRTGNSLYTAEGNFDSRVNVSNSRYTISGGSFSYYNKYGKTTAQLADGYHYTASPAPSVNHPTGCLDLAEGKENAVYVGGWAFDLDNISQSLEIHVYIGGPSGSGEGHVISADKYRDDVNSVYGVGNNHGFSDVIPTSLLGTQEVYLYAINIGNGENQLIGTGTVTITDKVVSEDVFQIEDGVLVKYTGAGGEAAIPENVTSIGDEAFFGCSNLTNISIPESVASIGSFAFYGCSGLTSINIPESVTDIGVCAFSGCSSLTDVNIQGDITSITSCLFSGCSSLKNIYMPESVTAICNEAFSCCSNLIDVNIPEGVAKIDLGAFSGCSSLTSIHIPESVTYIGMGAFSDCSSLVDITIPESVNVIGSSAFSNTPWLEKEKNQNQFVVVNHILVDGKKVSGNAVIPDSVTNIGSGAFSSCSDLVDISMPEGVTNIGSNAFSGCSGLASVHIPESVASIGSGAFSGCSSLASVRIPESITRIGSLTFYNCGSLTSIYIPESVTEIANDVFGRCADDFTMFVVAGSYAEAYAKDHGIPYRHMEESEHTHSYQKQITTQPSCATTGVWTYTCLECGDSYTEAIPATGHKYKKTTKNPTCTAKGTIICTCSICGQSYVEKTFPAVGHKYVTTVVPAVMGRSGVVTTVCKVCKEEKQVNIDAPQIVSLSPKEGIYNGRQQKPAVIVKDGSGKALRQGSDYTVSYQKDMKNVGKHAVAICFKGNYSGKTETSFVIKPKGTSISRVIPKRKGFDLKWKRQASQITGYEIAYSTSGRFPKKTTKIVVVKRSMATSKSISKLKVKKRYYVRIRTYKIVKANGKSIKLYSGWSKVKRVTTRK